MKKRIFVGGLVILLCLIGRKWWYDETHEWVDIGLSGKGGMMVATSYRDVEMSRAKYESQIIENYGLEMALALQDKDIESIQFVELPLRDKKTAFKKIVYLHFYCDACGHDENLKITEQEEKILSCDCPEDGAENKNAKEYFCILAYNSSVSE